MRAIRRSRFGEGWDAFRRRVEDLGGRLVGWERQPDARFDIHLVCTYPLEGQADFCGRCFTKPVKSWDASVQKGAAPIYCTPCSYAARGIKRQLWAPLDLERHAVFLDVRFRHVSAEAAKRRVHLSCLAGGADGPVCARNFSLALSRFTSYSDGPLRCPSCVRTLCWDGRRRLADLEDIRSRAKLGAGELLSMVVPEGSRVFLRFRCLALTEQGLPCGNVFDRSLLEVTKPKRKHPFICRACSYAARRRESRVGFRHEAYNAAKPLEERGESRTLRGLQHRAWARSVRVLWGQQCAISGPEQSTEVHHVFPWEKNPESRFILNYGVPLQAEHHRDFHYVYEPSVGLKRGMAGLAEFSAWFRSKTGREYAPLFPGVRIEMIFPITSDSRRLLEQKHALHAEGVNYVPVFPFECRTKMGVLYSMFMAREGVLTRRVGARTLKIIQMTAIQARTFFDSNHIQGYTSAGLALGLTDGQDILSAALFSKSRTPNSKIPEAHEWIRFASQRHTIVPGAASRILQEFIRLRRPKSVVTFADRRFCVDDPEGTMYPKLGFGFSHVVPPSYSYTDANGSSLLNKKRFQRKHLPGELGDQFDPELSERENMQRAGYHRLYDCGRFAYVLQP